MQDQITELAARLNTAATEDEARSVDLAIYHLRKDRKAQHTLTLNLLLAQIATLKELQENDDDRLHQLASEAYEKIESLTPPEQDEAA